MKAIAIENPGTDYRLVLREEPAPAPGAGEVLIQVAAAGLNNADLLQARGALSAAARRQRHPGHGSVGHHRGAGRRR